MASNTNAQQQQQQQQQQADFHADPNQQHMDHTTYTTSENQLAGLVQAATAAAGQDVSEWAAAAAAAAAAGHHHLENYPTDLHLPDDGFGEADFGSLSSPPPPQGTGRQVRGSIVSNGQGGGHGGLTRAASKKRKRGDEALDPALTGVGDQNEHQQQAFDGSELNIRQLAPNQSITDARAAGVHSAAALFRQPSNNKKYTRPPMSRLYASLELSPENFLHLQAAAKNYMLDENHPDRRDCVGQRGKGDTEMVKLRLWNCVRDFLEVEGYGERFFGEHVVNEGMPPRQYIWPRDQHKIISLVIPLLRRMVTNERQRQYAIETRKGGSGGTAAGGSAEDRKRRKRAESAAATEKTTPDSQQPQQQQQQLQQPSHVSVQHHGHDIHSHYVPPPPLPQQDFSTSGTEIGIGLSPLVLDGYPTDWDAISRSYNMYNQGYQLDTLWGVSGLQQPDWWGLVAAVDSHYKVLHDGNPTKCVPQCGANHLEQILTSDEISRLGWRIGTSDSTARTDFASSVTRDLDRIIKESLMNKVQGTGPDTHEETNHLANEHSLSQAPYLSDMHQSPYGSGQVQHHHHPHHQHHHPHSHETSPITLRFNVMYEGKRIFPRLDVTAEQCPDLGSLCNLIAHRWSGQFPLSTCDSNGNIDTTGWRIQAWLPEGLVTQDNDGDWTIAQLTAGTVDWMENDLRVLIDIGAGLKRNNNNNDNNSN